VILAPTCRQIKVKWLGSRPHSLGNELDLSIRMIENDLLTLALQSWLRFERKELEIRQASDERSEDVARVRTQSMNMSRLDVRNFAVRRRAMYCVEIKCFRRLSRVIVVIVIALKEWTQSHGREVGFTDLTWQGVRLSALGCGRGQAQHEQEKGGRR